MKTRIDANGFTLIEVMIVVAIIGILAAIAYPSYTQYVQRSRRDECAGQMMNMAAALERRYSTTGTYAGAVPVFGCPADGGNATYDLATNTAINPDDFTIRADPIGAQAGDGCGSLTLTSAGLKGATGGTVQHCWR